MIRVAYFSRGKMYLAGDSSGAGREVSSRFALDVVARALKTQERQGWKAREGEGMMSGRSVWNVSGAGGVPPVFATSIASGATADELFYFLRTDAVGGLFQQNLATSEEVRLFHRAGFTAHDLKRDSKSGRLACSVQLPNGTAHLAIMEPDGSHYREVTEGDSVDQCPWWTGEGLLYQSSGVARNSAGAFGGMGPSTLESLNLEGGDVETVFAQDGYDLMQPSLDAEGNLYFIRRPYEGPWGKPFSFVKAVQDVVLFPFRMARAMVHFFNVFSLFFSNKPLLTAGGVKQEADDMRRVILRGRLMDVKEALNRPGNLERSLVPAHWELIRKKASGEEQIVAKHVLAYDWSRDGKLIHTNGSMLYLHENGRSSKLAEAGLVEGIACLG